MVGTSKTVILKFVTTVNIVYPISFPIYMVTPTTEKKSLSQKCINSLVSHKFSRDSSSGFFGGGAYGSLPDAAFGGPVDGGWGRSNYLL